MSQSKYWVGWVKGYGYVLFDPEMQTEDSQFVHLFILALNYVKKLDRVTTRENTKAVTSKSQIKNTIDQYLIWKSKAPQIITLPETEQSIFPKTGYQVIPAEPVQPFRPKLEYTVGYLSGKLVVIDPPFSEKSHYICYYAVDSETCLAREIDRFVKTFVEEEDISKIRPAIDKYKAWMSQQEAAREERNKRSSHEHWSGYGAACITSYDYDHMND